MDFWKLVLSSKKEIEEEKKEEEKKNEKCLNNLSPDKLNDNIIGGFMYLHEKGDSISINGNIKSGGAKQNDVLYISPFPKSQGKVTSCYYHIDYTVCKKSKIVSEQTISTGVILDKVKHINLDNTSNTHVVSNLDWKSPFCNYEALCYNYLISELNTIKKKSKSITVSFQETDKINNYKFDLTYTDFNKCKNFKPILCFLSKDIGNGEICVCLIFPYILFAKNNRGPAPYNVYFHTTIFYIGSRQMYDKGRFYLKKIFTSETNTQANDIFNGIKMSSEAPSVIPYPATPIQKKSASGKKPPVTAKKPDSTVVSGNSADLKSMLEEAINQKEAWADYHYGDGVGAHW